MALPACVEERDISDSESHDVALPSKGSLIPVSLVFGGMLGAILKVHNDLISIINLTLLGVDPRPSQRLLTMMLAYLGCGMVPSSSFLMRRVGI